MAPHLDVLSLMLGRLEQKLDTTASRLEAHMEEERTSQAALSKRISTLEHAKTFALGIVAVVSAVVSWVSSHLLSSK